MDQDTDQLEIFKQRVEERIAATGKSKRGVSLRIGQKADFIRDITRGKSGKVRLPSWDTVELLADELHTDADYLVGKKDRPRMSAVPSLPPPEPLREGDPARRIPLIGQKDPNGYGLIVTPGTATGYVFAPPSLATELEAYALAVPDETMVPRYFPGEILFVHPRRAIHKGDFVAVSLKAPASSTRYQLIIRQMSSIDQQTVRLRQFNPAYNTVVGAAEPEEIEIPLDQITALHKITALEEA